MTTFGNFGYKMASLEREKASSTLTERKNFAEQAMTTFVVGAASGKYTINGRSVENQKYTLLKGETYTFKGIPSSHPLQIRDSPNAVKTSATGRVFGGTSGLYGDQTWTPDTVGTFSMLCTVHGPMGGNDVFEVVELENVKKEKNMYMKHKLLGMMGLTRDETSNNYQTRNKASEDTKDLRRGAPGGEEIKVKIHALKDDADVTDAKGNLIDKQKEYRLRKPRKTLEDAMLDIDDDELDFSTLIKMKELKDLNDKRMYWPLAENGDLGAIKVKGGHVYMKRIREVTDSGTEKVEYKMFRKSDNGEEKELGTVRQEEGKVSKHVFMDGNMKYDTEIGGMGLNKATHIVDDAKAKLESSEQNKKDFVKAKLDLEKDGAWDTLIDRADNTDMKEAAADSAEEKKMKKRRRRAYRKGLLQKLSELESEATMEKESVFKEMLVKFRLKDTLTIEKVYDEEQTMESEMGPIKTREAWKAKNDEGKGEHYFPMAQTGDVSCMRIEDEGKKIQMKVKSIDESTGLTTYEFTKKNIADNAIEATKEFTSKDDELSVVRFDKMNFALGGVTILGEERTVEMVGISEQEVDVSSLTLSGSIFARSSNSEIRVHVKDDDTLLITSHVASGEAAITLMDSTGATATVIGVDVAAPDFTPPTLTTAGNLSTVVADLNNFSLGSWPVDDNSALVDIRFPLGTSMTGTVTGTSQTAEYIQVTVNRSQFLNLNVDAPGDDTFSYRIRARKQV